jgi:hypothetical protein
MAGAKDYGNISALRQTLIGDLKSHLIKKSRPAA